MDLKHLKPLRKYTARIMLFFAQIYSNLGVHYKSADKLDTALEYFEKALGILLRIHSKRADNISSVYRGIGEVYRKRHEYKKAFENDSLNLSLCREQLPENDECTACAYSDVGDDYSCMEKYEEALEHYLHAYKIYGLTHSDSEKKLCELKENIAACRKHLSEQ